MKKKLVVTFWGRMNEEKQVADGVIPTLAIHESFFDQLGQLPQDSHS